MRQLNTPTEVTMARDDYQNGTAMTEQRYYSPVISHETAASTFGSEAQVGTEVVGRKDLHARSVNIWIAEGSTPVEDIVEIGTRQSILRSRLSRSISVLYSALRTTRPMVSCAMVVWHQK